MLCDAFSALSETLFFGVQGRLAGAQFFFYRGVRAQLFFSLIIRAQLFFSKNFRDYFLQFYTRSPPPPPPPPPSLDI